MASNVEEGYTAPEFGDDARKSVLDISSSDSTEFWLIQWPSNRNPDFNGQEMTFKVQEDGTLGSIDDSAGRDYEVVSFGSRAPNATAFVSSESGFKIAGKFTRQVSMVHYLEPEELEEQNDLKQMYQQASASKSSSKFGSSKHTQSSSKFGSSKHTQSSSKWLSSKTKSSLAEPETPKTAKKKRVTKPVTPVNASDQSSSRGRSEITNSGNSERSIEGKSKKKESRKG